MKIFLWGYMGCGKSTLRKELALPGFDFDEELLSRFGENHESLGEMIERIGWAEFRQKEFDLFEEVQKSKLEGVFSLGGGCLQEDFNWTWPNGSHEILIWINTDLETCWSRVKNDRNRPLVRSGKSSFEELFEKRKLNYQKSHFLSQNWEELSQYVTDATGRKV